MERICPQCGHEVEIFSVDSQVACENCGFVIYNDTLTCVQWCRYARQCMGNEMVERLLAVARQKEEREAAEQSI